LFTDNTKDFPAFAGFVEHASFPSRTYPMSVPWFAYASSTFLTTNMAFPALWTDPRNDPRAHVYNADITFSTSEPHLPKTATWTVSSNRLAGIAASIAEWLSLEGQSSYPQRRWDSSKRVEPFGFIVARYTVNAFTNYHSMIIPAAFSLERYRLRPDISALTNRVATTNHPTRFTNLVALYSGRLIACRHPVDDNIMPILNNGKRVDVTDLRFRNERYKVDHIRYSISNNWLVSTDAPYLQSLYKDKLTTRGVHLWNMKKSVFAMGFIVIILVPMLYAYKQHKRKGQI
jgi:hypothetical protein